MGGKRGLDMASAIDAQQSPTAFVFTLKQRVNQHASLSESTKLRSCPKSLKILRAYRILIRCEKQKPASGNTPLTNTSAQMISPKRRDSRPGGVSPPEVWVETHFL